MNFICFRAYAPGAELIVTLECEFNGKQTEVSSKQTDIKEAITVEKFPEYERYVANGKLTFLTCMKILSLTTNFREVSKKVNGNCICVTVDFVNEEDMVDYDIEDDEEEKENAADIADIAKTKEAFFSFFSLDSLTEEEKKMDTLLAPLEFFFVFDGSPCFTERVQWFIKQMNFFNRFNLKSFFFECDREEYEYEDVEKPLVDFVKNAGDEISGIKFGFNFSIPKSFRELLEQKTTIVEVECGDYYSSSEEEDETDEEEEENENPSKRQKQE